MDFAFDGFDVSFEEADYISYYVFVVCNNPLFVSPPVRGVFSRFTSTAAESEVVVGAEFSLVKLGRFAASELEDLSEILKKFFELDGVIFWPDIYGSIVDSSFGKQYLWKSFFSDFYIGITIVCLEEIVVKWLMLLDKVIFQIERFAFVFNHKEVYFCSLFEHFLFSERGGRKILSESFL
jgi:hypothetical protein